MHLTGFGHGIKHIVDIMLVGNDHQNIFLCFLGDAQPAQTITQAPPFSIVDNGTMTATVNGRSGYSVAVLTTNHTVNHTEIFIHLMNWIRGLSLVNRPGAELGTQINVLAGGAIDCTCRLSMQITLINNPRHYPADFIVGNQ